MITDDQVLAMFELADPARTTDATNATNTYDATGNLDALRTRSNNVTITENPPPTNRPQLPVRWLAAAAAAVVIVVGLVVLSGNGDSNDPPGLVPAAEQTVVDETEPLAEDAVPPEPAPADQQTVVDETEPLAEEALAPEPAPADQLAVDYLTAYALRDPGAVIALEAADFVLRSAYSDGGMNELGDVGFLSKLQQAASGVEYVDPECAVEETAPSETVVTCTARLRLAQHQAAGSQGVAVDVTVVITPDGVSRFDTKHREGFVSYLQAFDDWATVNCPTVLEDATTAEEQIAHGLLEAECADEWNAFVVDTPVTALADLETGDVDAFLARFAPDTPVLGVASDDATAAFTAFAASGAILDVTSCAPALVGDRAMNVRCDAAITTADSTETTGTLTLLVGPDGTIRSSDTTLDITNI